MTLPRLYAFIKAWDNTPPLAESVAALAFGIGVLKKKEKGPTEGTPEHKAAVAEFLNGVPMKRRLRPA